jgi:hypothetical protein
MVSNSEWITRLNEVQDAAEWIAKELLRARICVTQYKEKWGMVRVYCTFGFIQFHDLIYPGHIWNRFSPRMQWWDERVLGPIVNQLSWLLIPAQKAWYRRTYKRALSRWPHLQDSILSGPDYPDLLRGL